jgi:hypothetical protein
MMRFLALLAVLAPAPALAAELWCMPQQICGPDGNCHATKDEESSVRIADIAASATRLRSHGEDVAVTRTAQEAQVSWSGTNAMGQSEALVWLKADNAFSYDIRAQNGDEWSAEGACEVQ